jgi:hypothetical protein
MQRIIHFRDQNTGQERILESLEDLPPHLQSAVQSALDRGEERASIQRITVQDDSGMSQYDSLDELPSHLRTALDALHAHGGGHSIVVHRTNTRAASPGLYAFRAMMISLAIFCTLLAYHKFTHAVHQPQYNDYGLRFAFRAESAIPAGIGYCAATAALLLTGLFAFRRGRENKALILIGIAVGISIAAFAVALAVARAPNLLG